MDTSTKKYSELPFKDKAAYITAIFSFFLGWIMLFIGMFLPPSGEIHPTVITAFGTALVYAASIFGFALYIKSSSSEMYNDVMDKLSKHIDERLSKNDNDESK